MRDSHQTGWNILPPLNDLICFRSTKTEHNRNILTADQRTKMYKDRYKVIAEMADTFYIFSRSIFFNPEMVEQYNHSCDKYINYFTQIV